MIVGIFGIGRIGKVHAENITRYFPNIHIKAIADPFMNEESEKFCRQINVPIITKNCNDILNDKEIDTVLICSSTDTHSSLLIDSANAGKNIFCEKPIDYDLDKIKSALTAAKKNNITLQIGFCRRFDHNHKSVHDLVQAGKIGTPHIIKISSRDPSPPPISYVKVSGGIFYDMMIHDFDMARFLANDEVDEVYTSASVLVDKAIGEVGDVDTAVVTLKFKSGTIAVIDNSRQAVYGYDQRVEVFGSKGCAINGNDTSSTAQVWGEHETVTETIIKGMWDRYRGAFIAEIEAFCDAVKNKTEPKATGVDGLYSVLIAAAATKSFKEKRVVKLSEIVY